MHYNTTLVTKEVLKYKFCLHINLPTKLIITSILSQSYDVVSHITYVVCINFTHEWPQIYFFLRTFHGNLYVLLDVSSEIC